MKSQQDINQHFNSQQKQVKKLAAKVFCLVNSYHLIPYEESEGLVSEIHCYLEEEFSRYKEMLIKRGYPHWELQNIINEETAIEFAYCCLNDAVKK